MTHTVSHSAQPDPQTPTFSFEFFPPKTPEGSDKLFHHIEKLQRLKPSYVSVTYGAGGGTRQLSQELVERLKRETTLNVVPHLTCVCHNEREIDDILEHYAAVGIERILCLGGDPPRDKPDYDRTQDPFRYASDLVRFVGSYADRHAGTLTEGHSFAMSVAGFPEGHPATPDRLAELEHLKAKVDAGASKIITQLFFENRDFYDFRDRCRLIGINVPIIAGIMPITSAKGMRRMAQLAAGARFPAPLLKAIGRCLSSHGNNEDDADCKEAIRRVGVHWATEQSRDLLDNDVDGIHFYTLNHSTATQEIYATLGVRDSASLASPPTSAAATR